MRCCGTCRHLEEIAFDLGNGVKNCVQICSFDDEGEGVIGDREFTDVCDRWEAKQ